MLEEKNRAQLAGTVAFSPPTAVLDGSGIAIHMGMTAMHSDLTVLGPASCEGGFSVEQRVRLTAADGDQLTLTVHDESCPTETEGVLQGEGTYVVTGGTGRFAGAGGWGDFDGIGDLAHGTFVISLEGVISAPTEE